MNQLRAIVGCCYGAACLALVGCTAAPPVAPGAPGSEESTVHYQAVATQIDYPTKVAMR